MPSTSRPSLPFWAVLALPGGAFLTLSLLVSLSTQLRATRLDLAHDEARALVLADPLNLGLVQLSAFAIAIAAGVVYFYRDTPLRDALGLAPAPPSRIVLACVAGFALQFVLAEVSNLVQEVVPQPYEDALRQHSMVESSSTFHMLGAVLAIVVIAPVTEELLFRGLLVRGLAERYGRWFAIGAVALAFGLIHMSVWAILPAVIAGVLLGALTDRHDSVWPALALHASVNAVPLLLPSRLVAIRGFNVLSEETTHLPLPLLFGSALVATAALVRLFRAEPSHE